MGGTCSKHERDEECVQSSLESLKEIDHSENLGLFRWRNNIKMALNEIV